MTEPATLQEASAPAESQPTPATVSPFRNKGTFSTEKAREMLAKARAAKAAKAEARRQAELNPPPPVEKPAEALKSGYGEELELVCEQIAHTREVLNDRTPACRHCERGPLEPQHRAQLLKALDACLIASGSCKSAHCQAADALPPSPPDLAQACLPHPHPSRRHHKGTPAKSRNSRHLWPVSASVFAYNTTIGVSHCSLNASATEAKNHCAKYGPSSPLRPCGVLLPALPGSWDRARRV
jgi:hypothetical protein